MISKFSNPHFVPRSIQRVTRSDLLDISEPYADDLQRQNELNELIQSTLNTDTSSIHGRAVTADGDETAQTSVLFRLLSAARTVSLVPRPPSPSRTREPECEDSAAAAKTRRRFAKAAAVDASWVMQQSALLPPPFRVGRVMHVDARPELHGAKPPMMLVRRLQSPRKTRPPVPRSQLQRSAYVPAPPAPSLVASASIPTVDISAGSGLPHKARQRRRRKKEERVRPQATFWRAPVGCGGKSLGYAMGY
ncbi:hypothetical protein GGX14DRAFT_418006, partial [Mycena pura]